MILNFAQAMEVVPLSLTRPTPWLLILSSISSNHPCMTTLVLFFFGEFKVGRNYYGSCSYYVEDEHWFNSIFFLENKVQNDLNFHMQVVVAMHAQKFFTIDNFPYQVPYDMWTNVQSPQMAEPICLNYDEVFTPFVSMVWISSGDVQVLEETHVTRRHFIKAGLSSKCYEITKCINAESNRIGALVASSYR